MTIKEAIETITREELDTFLAGLDQEQIVDVNTSCGCFLDQLWREKAAQEGFAGEFEINMRYVQLGPRYEDRVSLPDFMYTWQDRCIARGEINNNAGNRTGVTPQEARHILAALDDESELDNY